ncbi:MAG: hypothetical protein HKN94_04700 [Acidimicrobiales bacterium]|nr:hypothetical protein [Acidimicrobiales bacterium]RZV44211.1 MAG: hypothetical protein EX269_12055 [Acidimicrobiales bacterium]
MSIDELRRGPGWWMDREGVWNPPELWPESAPPLPGWTRNVDGRWMEPMPLRPPPIPTDAAVTNGTARTLGYVEFERIREPMNLADPVRHIREAISAAALAAGAAVAVAAVLVTILLLVG